MKFNVTYTPKSTLLGTLKDIEEIKTRLIRRITTVKKYTKVTPPMFMEENDLRTVDMPSKTRPVTFDFGTEYKVASLALTHTNWLRSLIDRADLPMKEGLYLDASYIWRDGENDASASATKDELTFQYQVETSEAKDEARNVVQDVYEYMFQLNLMFKRRMERRNSWPEFAKYISAQSMFNEMPGETYRQREIDTTLENVAFIFESAGHKLYSGKTHSIIPPSLYDLKNFYQIVIKDTVNSGILKVASVAVLASGQTLVDQLHLNGLTNLLSNEYYTKLIEQKDKKVIEIKINIPRLAMAILNKGHIGEVQAGVISNESDIIKERNKINII